MCGIAGFVDYDGRPDGELNARIGDMCARIAHRGPDDHGAWTSRISAEAAVVLGHRRLSIIDLSSAGHQPMVSPSGRYVVTYNGEIYNFRPLRDELTSRGHAFLGGSDTEVLLAALEEWGVRDTLPRLVGMFAIGIWDARERLLFLVRDRLGIKPLYHGWLGSTYGFASELGALEAHPDYETDVDERALALYMQFLCVPAPFSIQRGIAKLEPGRLLVLDVDRRSETREVYWSLADVVARGARDPFRGSAGDALDALDGLVGQAVEDRLESDVPLGALLSGGIDSTAVVAAMAERASGRLRTYTIGFEDAAYDESHWAGEIARHLGTEHTELEATERQAIDTVPELASIYDEPFADSSQIPTYLVSRLARQHVTVALSGDGGDEQFVGYRRYALGDRFLSITGRVPAPLRRLASGALGLAGSAMGLAPGRTSRAGQQVETLARMVRCGDPATMWREILTIWSDPARVTGTRPPVWPPPIAGAEGLDPVEQMMLLDGRVYLPDDVLTKVDRASMSVALEVRVPLLDHRVVEFTSTLPLHMRWRDGVRKLLLRELVYRRVPRELADRPKKGFAVPLAAWLRGPLRDWAEPLLARPALEAAGLDPTPVRRLWREHVTGRRSWEHQIWTIVQYQAWRTRTRRSAD